MYDIIIKNGTVIDGTGDPMYRADIGIKEDRIVKIGGLRDEKGDVEIDASDRLVCPGFIDVDNHSDTYWRIFSDPDLESLVYQGITTIIGGNCGSSLAPILGPKAIESLQKWSDINMTSLDWSTVGEFLNTVARRKLSVNFATLVGHATLRRSILGDDNRHLLPKEIEFLGEKLAEAMKEGALGMSSGLIYTHARNADAGEVSALSAIVAKRGGLYVTHLRNEEKNLLSAVEEAVETARQSGVKMHISHLKAMGEKNWPAMDDALNTVARANEIGLDVTFDIYPYTHTSSVLYTFLPAWVSNGGKKMMLQRLKDPQIRAKVVSEMKNSDLDYSTMEIAISPLNKTLDRRKIIEISDSQNKTVEDTIIDILIASDGRVIASLEVLDEKNIEKALKSPFAMVSSNGSGYREDHGKTGESVHPRSFGTFPRILSRYVLGERILSWEGAVRKMTGAPALKFDLVKRGLLKEKYFADVTIIDPSRVKDLATPENPYRYSRGIDFVVVNGKLALSEGAYTGKRNGEIIRK